MKAAAIAPGSCGELVQGKISDYDFHVTCPINMFSRVEVEITKKRTIAGTLKKRKTYLAVRKTLDYLGYPIFGAKVKVNSSLPVGKGMASSTADVSAAILATAAALGKEIRLSELARIALSIEPSDGIFLPGLAFFDHRTGHFCETIGLPPEVKILLLDFGGTVDTISFNWQKKEYTEAELFSLRKALDLVKRGIKGKNPFLIGQGAILSAQINQKQHYKEHLAEVIEVAEKLGAYGVNVAHSGNIVGILHDPAMNLSTAFQRYFPKVKILSVCLIGGGVRTERGGKVS